jgi:rare lipoprotein A
MKVVLLALSSCVLVLSVHAQEVETGMASWYGYPYHGRHAASGEIYDMEQMTAAHRTLPFGTRVRVVNLTNEKAVEVRINDRGPFVGGRVIDLSKAAARAVDMLPSGVAAVRLELVDQVEQPESIPVPGAYAVQVGAFRDRHNAERYLAHMQSLYGAGRIFTREGDPIPWRVWVGAEATPEGASVLAARVRQESSVAGAFIVRLDP